MTEKKRFKRRKIQPQARYRINLVSPMRSRVPRQKKAHDSERQIICRKREKPNGTFGKSQPKLKGGIRHVPDEGAVERDLDAQALIVHPTLGVAVFPFKGVEKPHHAGNTQADDRQRIGGKRIGKVGNGSFRADVRHGIDEKNGSDREKNERDGDGREQDRPNDFFPIHCDSLRIMTVNAEPLPTSLSTEISLSVIVITRLTSESPNPLPCVAREVSP